VETRDLGEIDNLIVSRDQIWLVLSHTGDKQNLIYKHLKGKFVEIECGSFKGVGLYRFAANSL
jgi:hypothetical protein